MAYSTIRKTLQDGTLTLADNAAAHSLAVDYEEGNFSCNIPMEAVQLFLNRGKIDAVPGIRLGDDQPMTGSFNADLRDLSDAAYATLEEIVMWSGFVASTWVSTMGANGEVDTLDLTWLINGTVHGDVANHSIKFPYSVVRGGFVEGYPNKINLNWTSYAVRPTIIL